MGHFLIIVCTNSISIITMFCWMSHHRMLVSILWFNLQLERAQDGFSVVAEYYGRGVFNKVCLNADDYM